MYIDGNLFFCLCIGVDLETGEGLEQYIFEQQIAGTDNPFQTHDMGQVAPEYIEDPNILYQQQVCIFVTTSLILAYLSYSKTDPLEYCKQVCSVY